MPGIQITLLLVRKGLAFFEGLTCKTRGHLGFMYVYMKIYNLVVTMENLTAMIRKRFVSGGHQCDDYEGGRVPDLRGVLRSFFLGCDIGGAKELGVIYFPTNWGAKEPQNLPNHRVVFVSSKKNTVLHIKMMMPSKEL